MNIAENTVLKIEKDLRKVGQIKVYSNIQKQQGAFKYVGLA